MPFAASFTFNFTLTLVLILFSKPSYQASDEMELEADMLKLYWTLGKQKLFFIWDCLRSDRSFSAISQPAATVRSQGGSDFCCQHRLFPLWLRQAFYKASQIPRCDSSGISRKGKGGTIPLGYQSTVFFFTLVSIWKTCLGFHSWEKWSSMLISLEIREDIVPCPSVSSCLLEIVLGGQGETETKIHVY